MIEEGHSLSRSALGADVLPPKNVGGNPHQVEVVECCCEIDSEGDCSSLLDVLDNDGKDSDDHQVDPLANLSADAVVVVPATRLTGSSVKENHCSTRRGHFWVVLISVTICTIIALPLALRMRSSGTNPTILTSPSESEPTSAPSPSSSSHHHVSEAEQGIDRDILDHLFVTDTTTAPHQDNKIDATSILTSTTRQQLSTATNPPFPSNTKSSFQQCKLYLGAADTLPTDNSLNREPEFVRFVNVMFATTQGPEQIFSDFSSLPNQYQELFEAYADSQTGRIEITGALPSTPATEEQLLHLEAICQDMLRLLEGDSTGTTTTTTNSASSSSSSPPLSGAAFLEVQQCRLALATADAPPTGGGNGLMPGDFSLNKEPEFVTFVTFMLQTAGATNIFFTGYDSLILEYQDLYEEYADQETGQIDVTGALPFTLATPQQEANLQAFCQDMSSLIAQEQQQQQQTNIPATSPPLLQPSPTSTPSSFDMPSATTTQPPLIVTPTPTPIEAPTTPLPDTPSSPTPTPSISQCIIYMSASDTFRRDDRLEELEFVRFVNRMIRNGQRYSTFNDMPFDYQDFFREYATDKVEYAGDVIDITGAWPGSAATPNQRAHLETMCEELIEIIQLQQSEDDEGGGVSSPTTLPMTQASFTICRINLAIADRDRNRLLSQTEYIRFLNRMGNNAFLGVTSFSQLPTYLQDTYNDLAVGGNIDIRGASPVEFASTSDAQVQFLEQICATVQSSLNSDNDESGSVEGVTPTGTPSPASSSSTPAPSVLTPTLMPTTTVQPASDQPASVQPASVQPTAIRSSPTTSPSQTRAPTVGYSTTVPPSAATPTTVSLSMPTVSPTSTLLAPSADSPSAPTSNPPDFPPAPTSTTSPNAPAFNDPANSPVVAPTTGPPFSSPSSSSSSSSCTSNDISLETWMICNWDEIMDSQRLDLRPYPGVSGTFPTLIGMFPQLTSIRIPHDQGVVGTLPTELGMLTDLEELYLMRNELTGTIPSELGRMTSLELLRLGGNQGLSGTLPTHLGSMTAMTILSLFDNQLTGTIPTEMGGMTRLKILDLEDNSLTGIVPAEVCALTMDPGFGFLDIDCGEVLCPTSIDCACTCRTGASPQSPSEPSVAAPSPIPNTPLPPGLSDNTLDPWNGPWDDPWEDPWEGVQPADVVKWNNGGMNGLRLEIVDAFQPGPWKAILRQVVDDYNSGSPNMPNVLELSLEEIGADPDCEPIENKSKVCNGDYGASNWRSINMVLIHDGYIVATTSKMNEHYLADATLAMWRYSLCHELGHGFGLPHSDEDFFNADLGNCMDYTEIPEANMHTDESMFLFLNDLYGTTSSASEPSSPPAKREAPLSIPDDVRAKLKQDMPRFKKRQRKQNNHIGHEGGDDFSLLYQDKHREAYSVSLGGGWRVKTHVLLDTAS